MSEWLKLTAEDIAAIQPPPAAVLPVVLRIGAADLPAADKPHSFTSAGQLLTITAADLTAVPPQPTAIPDLAQLEQLMFGLVNQARQQNLPRWLKKASLRWHNGVAAVARGHALDMQQRQYIDHVTPEGVTAVKRIERYGLSYLACGENIGVVYGPLSHGPEGIYAIHNAFINQPRSLTNHRGNLLNPMWTHIGIGVAYAPTGVLIVTQNFICTLKGSALS